MMKLVVLFAVVAVALARPDGEYYPSKYDDFDADSLLSNDRLLQAYTHCFIGTGKCTPEGKEIRDLIPEAVQNVCAKCSPKQKSIVAKIILAIKEKLTEDYEKLLDSADPKKEHREDLKKFLEEHGKKE